MFFSSCVARNAGALAGGRAVALGELPVGEPMVDLMLHQAKTFSDRLLTHLRECKEQVGLNVPTNMTNKKIIVICCRHVGWSAITTRSIARIPCGVRAEIEKSESTEIERNH